MGASVIRLTWNDERLANYLFNFATSRDVIKELGYPIHNNSKCIWYIMDWNGKTVGFVCAEIHKDKIIFCHDYVIKMERRTGCYKELFKSRYADLINEWLPIQAVCTRMSVLQYLKYDFKVIRESKNYTWVLKQMK
jgi:hypothetical protein